MTKFHGVLPAFYACYGADGAVDQAACGALAEHLWRKGVNGLYVCGSSGECIYLDKDERKATLEAVMRAVGGKLPVIAHVACNNTRDSVELAAHAEGLGVDAIAAIPPIYFHLPEHAIARYWNDISAAAPHTDFVIYNIPQLAGVSLTLPLLREMLKNPRVTGVKNSSMLAQDIQLFKSEGKGKLTVFNGPDEQFIAGRAIGADAGIGGTYAVMPELFLRMDALVRAGDLIAAQSVQYAANEIIYAMCACHGNLYAVMKEILRRREGLKLGGVRKPLPEITEADSPRIEACARMIDEAVRIYA